MCECRSLLWSGVDVDVEEEEEAGPTTLGGKANEQLCRHVTCGKLRKWSQ